MFSSKCLSSFSFIPQIFSPLTHSNTSSHRLLFSLPSVFPLDHINPVCHCREMTNKVSRFSVYSGFSFFGHAPCLVGSQSPDQGWNPGLSPKHWTAREFQHAQVSVCSLAQACSLSLTFAHPQVWLKFTAGQLEMFHECSYFLKRETNMLGV